VVCTFKRYAEASRERTGQMVHGQWDGRVVPLKSGSWSQEAEVRKLKPGSPFWYNLFPSSAEPAVLQGRHMLFFLKHPVE